MDAFGIIVFNRAMGSKCCKSDTSTIDTELGIPKHRQDIFFQEYEKIGKRYQQIKEAFPKPYHNIQKNRTTKIVDQGYFLGKQNIKIRAGYGIMLYDCGLYYIGMWQNNARSGLGYMIDRNGSYYKGEWRNDLPEGYGQYTDGTHQWVYRGKWKNGLKEGPGQETFPDGTTFSGGFSNNLKNGSGKFFFENQCYFSGYFVDDIADGPECEQKAEDYLFKGPCKDNDFHGPGRVIYYNEQKEPTEMYIGQFYEGTKHGYGEYTWDDSSSYKGEWDHGNIANKGVYIEGG